MRKVSFAIFSTLLFCLSNCVVSAQNIQHPWSISAGAVYLKYYAPSSLGNWETGTYEPAIQLSFSRYLGGAFDFRTQLTVSNEVSFPSPLAELPANTFKSRLIDMSYLLSFKINNGVFLKQNSFLGPYLIFGIGGSYVEQNPDVYIPLGGGIKFRVNERIDIRAETSKKFSVNKDFQNIAHAVSVSYNVGKQKEVYPQSDITTEEIIEETKPIDTDEDGISDQDDLCPDQPGISRLFGCPEEEKDSAEVIDVVEVEKQEPVQVQETEPEAQVVKDPEIEKAPISTIETQPIVQEPAMVPEEKSIEVKNEEKLPCNISLSTNDYSLYFEIASADLLMPTKQKLDEIAALMQACKSSSLHLKGYTDASGEERNNKALSVLRAHRVKYYLVYEHGIRQNRIESEGYGESNPVANNDTDKGRERNRRVDFTLIR